MAERITMPKLGLTMDEGTVEEWRAEPGQAVSAGDVLLVIETEKTSMEVEAESDGIVQQVAKPGETVEVEGVLGYLLAPGEGLVESDA
jgi:pyruvate/2-oxoglutarate dehydrogenase complex dihydrolipoamide acyltransferase (E2) component